MVTKTTQIYKKKLWFLILFPIFVFAYYLVCRLNICHYYLSSRLCGALRSWYCLYSPQAGFPLDMSQVTFTPGLTHRDIASPLQKDRRTFTALLQASQRRKRGATYSCYRRGMRRRCGGNTVQSALNIFGLLCLHFTT